MAGDLCLTAEPVDLAPVIDAAVGMVRLDAEARGVRVDITRNPGVGQVAGEAKRLEHVVRYLVARAVKVTPSGGRVGVRLQCAGDHAEITVTDGWDAAPDLARSSEPSSHPASRPSDHHEGLGLGWWIARYLVKLHGGAVVAKSAGEGFPASVTARFPLVEGSRRPPLREPAPTGAPTVGASPGSLARPSLAGVAVLVVDDDLDALTMLGVMLSDAGATVHRASSAGEAMRLARHHPLSALVSDLAMPGQDGFSLIRSLRASDLQRGRHTPAIALTAYVRAGDRASAMAAGFDLFVNKPVDPAELIGAIAQLAGPRVEAAGAGRRPSDFR